MTIERKVGANGAICDTVKLTDEECSELDRCHEIIRSRFEESGETYADSLRETCEWWLEGLLRFEGAARMMEAAKNAPLHAKGKLVRAGYSGMKEVRQ